MPLRNRYTPWYREQLPAITWTATVLAEVDAAFVPTLLRDLEARKTPALWESDAAYLLGYDALCKQQEALLMNIGDRLISEVRALRNGDQTPVEARDPQADPYTLPLASLLGINTALVAADGRDVASILQGIEAILQQQGAGEEGQLEALLQIVALLSV